MPSFITIGYGDQAGYDHTDPAVRDAAHAHDAALAAAGAVMGRAGSPVQVRNHGGAGVSSRTGAFMAAPLPVAGFALIEAPDLETAIQMASGSPCAVADGVIEVWPIG